MSGETDVYVPGAHRDRAKDLLGRVELLQRELLDAANLLLESLRYADDEFPIDPVQYGSFGEYHSWHGAHALVAATAGMEATRASLTDAAAHLAAEEVSIDVMGRLLREKVSPDENWNRITRDDPAYQAALAAIPAKGESEPGRVLAPIVKAIVD